MRICTVNGIKALFHRWEDKSRVIDASPLPNGHRGGTVRYTNGIVEYEDGRVESVPSHRVVFQDSAKLFAKVEKEIKNWEYKQALANETGEGGGEFSLLKKVPV